MASSLKVNRVVPSTGTNIGFGTASGEIRLASTSKLTWDGDTNTYINHPSADTIAGFTAGSERLRITSEGQVELTGTNSGNHMTTFGSNVGGLTIDDVGNQNTGLEVSHGSNKVFLVASSNNSVYFSSYGTGSLIFEHTGSGGTRERLRITSAGLVGIGTNSPDTKLEVYNSSTSGNTSIKVHNDKTGDAAQLILEGKRTSDNDTGQLLFKNNNYGVAGIFANAGGSGNHDGGHLRFYTSEEGSGDALSQRMRITKAGEVLIGRYLWGASNLHPNDVNKVVITGPTPGDTYHNILMLEGSETTGAINTGGSLAFGGHDGTTNRNWANIWGMKENGNSNNTAGYMAFHTRPAGGNPTEWMRIASDGGIFMDAGYGSVGEVYGVRAWVSFNGTGSGSTRSKRGSGNVTSVGDNDTGDYTVNFTVAMPDTGYAVSGISENWEGTNADSYTHLSGYTGGTTTASYRFKCLRSRYDQQPPQFKDSPFIQLIFVR